jgi:hypothetical protein
MYISRSDWREFVERLDAAERKHRENGYLLLAHQKELTLARVQVLALESRAKAAETNYRVLRNHLADLLDQS